MKTVKLIIVLVILIISISCHKDNVEAIKNVNVDQYIELLKSNQYDSLNLPAFTSLDVPALLKYRNETQIITNFPHNQVSSLWRSECKLGMYVLWTIESIRAVSINSEYLIRLRAVPNLEYLMLRFPSPNPILALRNTTEHTLVDSDESHRIAAKAYYNWWYENRNKSFSAFMNIDPLEKTIYSWL